MRRILSIALAMIMVLSVTNLAFAQDNSDYTIRIYSNTNYLSEVQWLAEKAKEAGFNISIDDNSVISGDSAAVQAANENKDGDIIMGLNETRWSQIINGTYENLSLVDWTPAWAGDVGDFAYPGKAYGTIVQNILMLYRTDEYGTNGNALHFQHWSDLVDAGYTWYRQGKVGGTTNGNINNSLLYPYTDPTSPAGGISIEGWKKLWAYCAGGNFTGDSYGLDPLNQCKVQVSTFFSSQLYIQIDDAASSSEHPLMGTLTPSNWALVDIDDGTYYISEYIGVLNREGRTPEQTEICKKFAEWFGSAEVMTAWSEEFDTYPSNQVAAANIYGTDIPVIYTLPNFARTVVPGTDMMYYEYVAAHNAEWTNIMTNLGFYWKDMSAPAAEPDWENLNWPVLCQSAK